jgi:hypothetical protein
MFLRKDVIPWGYFDVWRKDVIPGDLSRANEKLR